ncbi:MAG: dihydroorotase family protein [Candidatus Cloacimonadaceae bacterium]|jgi:dihydropyrimidinase|nr:dihydroorotase family protein [Candidatus Cloacimonadota bacterium]MDY0127315.1 dihydroorotase family protein [Candidatus Cloacimonadaceae bacterium]MCB5254488.1 dihydroorotase family protein [Candidatus Cloacimonadota bacterium]MCK9178368.1 dihydroorotase family protein [Candidatus Cloacimonadota bacterium]MCK9243086.1 dihydroorotase family protein [Candidatus Cloacimonadota bacterium]
MTEIGYYDFHVHIGEKTSGHDLADDFGDLRRLTERQPNPENPPLLGIGAFVTERPDESLSDTYQRMNQKAARDFGKAVQWHLTPIKATVEELYPLLEQGADLKLYTTYRQAGLYSSYEKIGQWMSELSDLKTRILVHCEDDLIVERSSEQFSFRQSFDHSLRRPEIAEDKAVGMVLNLAVKHQHPVHIVHVSSPVSALLIKEAKRSFAGITCETAPQYLLFNEERLREKDAHRYLCTPPYRKESSRGKLVELLQDGIFDILASDHCSFPDELKDSYKDDLPKLPQGIAGVVTLYTSIYESLVKSGKISLQQLVDLTLINPKELMQGMQIS